MQAATEIHAAHVNWTGEPAWDLERVEIPYSQREGERGLGLVAEGFQFDVGYLRGAEHVAVYTRRVPPSPIVEWSVYRAIDTKKTCPGCGASIWAVSDSPDAVRTECGGIGEGPCEVSQNTHVREHTDAFAVGRRVLKREVNENGP